MSETDLDKNGEFEQIIALFPHSSYSPVLAFADFYLFPELKFNVEEPSFQNDRKHKKL